MNSNVACSFIDSNDGIVRVNMVHCASIFRPLFLHTSDILHTYAKQEVYPQKISLVIK